MRYVAVIAIVGILTACAGIFEPALPAGSRELLISVENQSAQPARLFVAEDEFPMGEAVGTAVPDTIAPGATERVTLTLPPGQNWAIFVNPTEEVGALIHWADVPPDAGGAVPLTITVQRNGLPTVAVSDGPGWFGN